jgi:hypothetical protein
MLVALALLGGFGTACGDELTGPAAREPAGLTVTLYDATIIRVRDGAVEGGFHTHLFQYSGQFFIALQNARGGDIALGADDYLDVVVADESIARFEQVSAGTFEGTVVTVKEGITSIVFRVMRGPAGAREVVWSSPAIQLAVIQC